MKQHIKAKSIKWKFKIWYQYESKIMYFYQLDIYKGSKTTKELNFGEKVVFDLCKYFKNTFCFICFDNFFNSLMLINKFHDEGLYSLGTVCSNRKQNPKTKGAKQMQCGDHQIKPCRNIACIKWMDNHSVLLIGSNMENISSVSSVSRREKGSTTKKFINCPNAMKMYNAKTGGVDFMDQLKFEYRLSQRSKFCLFASFFLPARYCMCQCLYHP